MIPTSLIANQLDSWFPSRQLESSDWVIEPGVENTSWDLVTMDFSIDSQTEDDGEILEIGKEESSNSRSKENDNTKKVDPDLSSKADEHTKSLGRAIPSIESLIGPAESSVHTLKVNPHPQKMKPTVKKHTSRKPKIVRKGKCNVKNPDIAKSGHSQYQLPKAVLKHYSTHWKEASRLAHLSWATGTDGQNLGVRIRGISCNSPLKFTGLKRGDIVVSINGHDVQSEKDLLKVYGKLMFWKKMDVTIKRGSTIVSLHYNIV
jgi:hypothetical protein